MRQSAIQGFALALVMGYSAIASAASLRPVSLRCEYRVNPRSIEVANPSLSWLFESTDASLRGQAQTAYQVLVASSPRVLAEDKGNLWDSGLVESNRSIHVIYRGKPLASRARCFWKVRVRNAEGRLSAWSDPAMWDMGLLQSSDWHGSWIGAIDPRDANPREPVNGYHARAAHVELTTGSLPGAETPWDIRFSSGLN